MTVDRNECQLYLIFITTVTIVANPVCNRTTPIGKSLSFYGTQERSSVTIDKYFYLTCCAQLYETIEWYKNIISPSTRIKNTSRPNNCNICQRQHYFRLAEEGQVLKVYEGIEVHAGLYFCVIKNGSDSNIFQQEVEIKLRSNVNEHTDEIKSDSCKQNVETHIGANVTVCCTFMELAQEGMDIRWEATINGMPFHLQAQEVIKSVYTTFVTHISAVKIENGKNVLSEVTAYLTLYNVTNETYGTYVATSWSNQNSRHGNCTIVISPDTAVESKLVTVVVSMVMSFILAISMMTMLAALYFWKRYHMTIWLLVSDLLPINDDEEAMYDAFISHSNTDEDRIFAVEVLRPLLEKYNYTTCIDVINFPAGGIRFDDGIAAVNVSRRCILVLSPDYVNNIHCRYELHAALQDMKNLRARCLKIVPVTFKDTSKNNLNQSKHLQRVLVAVRKIKWTPDNVQNFEKKLVSRMASISLKNDNVPQSSTNVNEDATFTITELNSKHRVVNLPFDRFYNPSRSLYREISVISDQHPNLSK